MNKYYVYALLDPRKNGAFKYDEFTFDHEPFYIGKGCGERAFLHMRGDLKRAYNAYKDNKIKKILQLGMNPIVIKIICDVEEKIAFEKEIELIKIIGRKEDGGPLTNIYEGGLGSSKSQETRQKISGTKKRQYASGEFVHPLLNTKWSTETREKILTTRKNNPYKWSDSQKKDLQQTRKLKKNKSQTCHWEVTDPNGQKTIVYGLGEFCRDHDLQQAHLFSVSKGTRKHHKGWTCKKINDPTDNH